MSKTMITRTFKLPEGTAKDIDEIAAKEGTPKYMVIVRATWYYKTLRGRLAEAICDLLMPKLEEFVAAQNVELIRLQKESEDRIVERLSSGKP